MAKTAPAEQATTSTPPARPAPTLQDLQAEIQRLQILLMQAQEEKTYWSNQVFAARGIIGPAQPNSSSTPAPAA